MGELYSTAGVYGIQTLSEPEKAIVEYVYHIYFEGNK
jgi:hypothetical protein